MCRQLFIIFSVCLFALSTWADVYLPADNNPADGRVSTEEFDAYCEAWRHGEDWAEHFGPIPIDFVTRTAYIVWEFDGYYDTDPEGDPDEAGSYNGSSDTSYGSVTVISIGGLELPHTVVYWRAARVFFSLTPPEGTYACAVEMPVSAGWYRLPDDEQVRSTDETDLDTMPTGTTDAGKRTVRWGPYKTSEIPPVLGFGLIAMDGAIVPDTAELTASVSYDGVSGTVSDFQTTEPQLNIVFGWDLEALDPGLQLDGPLLERALAGRANRPKEKFAPEFERFIDDEGRSCMRCTLVRDVIYPEMGFTIQRTSDFTTWEPLPVEWTLVKQKGRDLTFETTFPCLDNGQPESYRVWIEENTTGAADLARQTITVDYSFGNLVIDIGDPIDPGHFRNPILISNTASTVLEFISNANYVYRIDDTEATLAIESGYAVIYISELAEVALQIAQRSGLENYPLPGGDIVLINPGELELIDSTLYRMITRTL